MRRSRKKSPSINVTGKQASYIGNWLHRHDEFKNHSARDWLWDRVSTAYHNGTTIALRLLTEPQLELLLACYKQLEGLTGGRAKPTRKAARRQLAVLDEWKGRSAIDRLGDVA